MLESQALVMAKERPWSTVCVEMVLASGANNGAQIPCGQA